MFAMAVPKLAVCSWTRAWLQNADTRRPRGVSSPLLPATASSSAKQPGIIDLNAFALLLALTQPRRLPNQEDPLRLAPVLPPKRLPPTLPSSSHPLPLLTRACLPVGKMMPPISTFQNSLSFRIAILAPTSTSRSTKASRNRCDKSCGNFAPQSATLLPMEAASSPKAHPQAFLTSHLTPTHPKL